MSIPVRTVGVVVLVAVVLLAPAAQPAWASKSVRVRITGSSSFPTEQPVAVTEALLVPTISVFAGKSGVVRVRGGVVAPFVVLASQPVGCGHVQTGLPAIQGMTKKSAAALEERLSKTRPRPAAPLLPFATGPREFVVVIAGAAHMDAAEIRAVEADANQLPFLYRQLANGPAGDTSIAFSSYLVTALHAESPTARDLSELRKVRGEPPLVLVRKDGRLRAELAVSDDKIVVRGSVPLEICPPLEHLHIEPK